MRSKLLVSALSFSLALAACSETPSAPEVAARQTQSGPMVTRVGKPIPEQSIMDALSVSIYGDSEVSTGYNTWNAVASGGDGTYSYQWQFRPADYEHLHNANRWYNVGSNSSSYEGYVVSEASSFELRVIVTSGGQSVTSDSFWVYHERACQSWC